MELLIYTILRALVVGIVISAPMGPVGVLCIQRTLNSGRLSGFYTGVGAAISDLFYCLITCFGLSLIEDFITDNQSIIQLIGSLVLVGFGIYLFRKKPMPGFKNKDSAPASPRNDILTGFLFTVSNPLIIFLIIGIFARMNFLEAGMLWYHYVGGFIFIAVGALLWWYSITWCVNKVRTHFNLRSMWLINRITGTIILIFACVGIITSIKALAA
ncbi:MAG: LysE family transporter [Bacteroidales bacterium]|nr:LysE family transporter [Bacteroidales bacterium]